MVVKVEAALGAIERGVGRVVFSDARAEGPLRRALAGEGHGRASHGGDRGACERRSAAPSLRYPVAASVLEKDRSP